MGNRNFNFSYIMVTTHFWSSVKHKIYRRWSRKNGKHPLNRATLLLDTRGDSGCAHCPHSLLKSQFDFKQNLSLEEARHVAEQLRKIGCLHCTISGGDPQLRPDIFDILGAFRKQGIATTLFANDLQPELSIMRRLKKAGLHRIRFNLFGSHAASHDRYIVDPGSFENTIEVIQVARERKIACCVSVMPTHENIVNGEFRKILSMAELQKLEVDVHYPALVGEFTGEYNHLLTKDELNYVRQFFQLNHVKADFTDDGKIYRCPAGWETIQILPDGSVCPCEFIHISFGNILTESLDEILPRIWSTKIFTGQASRCLVGESQMFNRIYLQPVFNAGALPLYYKNHIMFIEGEPLIRFYVNASGRIIEKSEDVALEAVKTLRVM